MTTVAVDQMPAYALRAAFARGLAAMYGREVPAYETLVEVTREVNAEVVATRGKAAERLGSVERVTAERHGAIRVGSPRELRQAARVFAAFGMHPVGFYDLRDAGPGAVPVVSPAFRPVDRDELARNPFRVFTSMLVPDDPRYFDADTRARVETFVEARTLFGPALLALADRAAAEGGLPQPDADELLRRATAAFALSTAPVDRQWYDHLERISSVAADIGGVPSTHINHLTPRVLDIDALQARMCARGIEMIDEIPPAWEGPDVLLRQTSFRALAERRTFRYADRTVGTGALRVRFGEVEQRGIALTPRGRDVYDRMVAEVDARVADGAPRPDAAREVWRRDLPRTECELAVRGLAFFTYRATGRPQACPVDQRSSGARRRSTGETTASDTTLGDLVEAGVLTPEPIVYEDFLPRSAAGIFRSNLAADGTRDEQRTGRAYDIERLSEVLDTTVHDPMDLYAAEQERSVRAAEAGLGICTGKEPA
ncbi:MAG: hypothetical protein K0R87_2067 [Pseudonocardia sp.]|nr:hypothetical protein [Pseudonocardia sp.]